MQRREEEAQQVQQICAVSSGASDTQRREEEAHQALQMCAVSSGGSGMRADSMPRLSSMSSAMRQFAGEVQHRQQ